MRSNGSPRASWVDDVRRHAYCLVLVGLVLVHLTLSWLGRNAGIGWGEDDAQYIQLARSLSHFQYREIWDVDASFHARYPPLFPALLAVVGATSHWSVDAMLMFVAVCSAVSLVLFYDAARRRVDPLLALLAVLLTAVNPMGLEDTAFVMSEAPFKLFLAIALWGLSREGDGGRFAVIAALGAVASALTRSAGVVVVGAMFLYWCYRRQFGRAFWFALLAAGTVGVWMVWSFTAPEATAHRLYGADLAMKGVGDAPRFAGVSILHAMLADLPGRLQRLFTMMMPTVLAFRTLAGTLVDNVGWLLLLLLTGSVGFLQLMRRWPAATAVLVVYVLLVVTWTWELERLLTPVTPLLFLTMLLGVAWWGGRMPLRWRTPLLTLVVVMLMVGPILEVGARIAVRVDCDRDQPSVSVSCFEDDERLFLQMAEWVRDSTPQGAAVLTNKEAAFSLRSGRRGVNQLLALEESPATILPFLRERGVAYAVVSPVGTQVAAYNHLLAGICPELVLLKGFGQVYGILRLRGPGEVANGLACAMLARWSSPLLEDESRR